MAKKADKATVMTPSTSLMLANTEEPVEDDSYCPFTAAAEQLRDLLDSPSAKGLTAAGHQEEEDVENASVLSTSAPPRLRLTNFALPEKACGGEDIKEESRDSSLDYQDDLKSIVQVYFESNNLETSYCSHCSAMFPLPNVRFCCDCGAPRDNIDSHRQLHSRYQSEVIANYADSETIR